MTKYLLIALSTLTIYLFLVVLVRLFGRRQLGQLTPVDLLVMILLGSCVETAMIRADTSLRAGLVSAATLLVANRFLCFLVGKSKRLRHLLVAGPVLIVHNGKLVNGNLHKLGLTEGDVMEGLRGREETRLEDVRFGVMEADGTINVVRRN